MLYSFSGTSTQPGLPACGRRPADLFTGARACVCSLSMLLASRRYLLSEGGAWPVFVPLKHGTMTHPQCDVMYARSSASPEQYGYLSPDCPSATCSRPRLAGVPGLLTLCSVLIDFAKLTPLPLTTPTISSPSLTKSDSPPDLHSSSQQAARHYSHEIKLRHRELAKSEIDTGDEDVNDGVRHVTTTISLADSPSGNMEPSSAPKPLRNMTRLREANFPHCCQGRVCGTSFMTVTCTAPSEARCERYR